jgi:5-amino-6-(5-phospho-D-ribitylamino)uracil phosphatase
LVRKYEQGRKKMNKAIEKIALPIKLIAFDLDGTLLNQDHIISDRSREAILKLKDKGFKLLVTTGRTISETKEVCEGLSFDGYVCSNGMINLDENFSVIQKEWIPSSAVFDILNQLNANKINYELNDELGDIYVAQEDMSFLKKRIERVRVIPKEELCSSIENGSIKILKFQILTIHNNIVIQDYIHVEDLPVAIITVSPYNVEINKSGINKWIGLKHHLERLNLSDENVLAFGDSMNDIEILMRSGWSVAMKNAEDKVKASSRDITLSHNDDGVAYYLENYIL